MPCDREAVRAQNYEEAAKCKEEEADGRGRRLKMSGNGKLVVTMFATSSKVHRY